MSSNTWKIITEKRLIDSGQEVDKSKEYFEIFSRQMENKQVEGYNVNIITSMTILEILP